MGTSADQQRFAMNALPRTSSCSRCWNITIIYLYWAGSMSWGTDKNLFLEAKRKQAKNNHRFLKNCPVIQGTFLVVVLSGAAMITFGICHSAKKKTRPGNPKTAVTGNRHGSMFSPKKKGQGFQDGEWAPLICADARSYDFYTLIIVYIYIYIYVWLVVWNIFYFSIYWEEESQLTFIFFRGVETTNRVYIYVYIYVYMYICIYVYIYMYMYICIKRIDWNHQSVYHVQQSSRVHFTQLLGLIAARHGLRSKRASQETGWRYSYQRSVNYFVDCIIIYSCNYIVIYIYYIYILIAEWCSWIYHCH